MTVAFEVAKKAAKNTLVKMFHFCLRSALLMRILALWKIQLIFLPSLNYPIAVEM